MFAHAGVGTVNISAPPGASASATSAAARRVLATRNPRSQRVARWLLTTRDRVDGDSYPLTQEFLAQMLGARRPTVSQTARRLQDRGLIRYSRGVMHLLDRDGLGELACSCYYIVRREFAAMTEGG